MQLLVGCLIYVQYQRFRPHRERFPFETGSIGKSGGDFPVDHQRGEFLPSDPDLFGVEGWSRLREGGILHQKAECHRHG